MTERPEADTCKSDSYMCHHYERDTCLIHFKCCPEKDWYACHKCHNEALGLVENLTEKALENEEPSAEHSDDNLTTYIPGEMEDSSSQAETSSEHEDPHNHASTGGQAKRNKTVTGETSHWPTNTEEEGSEESSSQPQLDASSPSPKEHQTKHSVATALDGTRLKCAQCGEKQEFSQYCVSCDNFSFATYFCGECKLLIEKKVDPYHCDDCGICRGDKANHFHCHVCNICMVLSLKENHKCFADRGHDPCAICFEEVFSGAVIFPCHHMIHKDCAEKLVLSGSNLCPMCRSVIFQEDEKTVVVEETAQQIPSNEWTAFSSVFCLIGKRISGAVSGAINSLYKVYERDNTNLNRTGSTEIGMYTETTEREMTNVLTTEIVLPEFSYTTGAYYSTV